jgi:hypothetical protein
MIDDVRLEAKHGSSQVRIRAQSSQLQYLKMWLSLNKLLQSQNNSELTGVYIHH